MSDRFKLTKTPHRESPPFMTEHHVCRECHHIQPVVVIRGWNVCYNCLSQIDRLFCEWRAQTGSVEFRAEIEAGTKEELRAAQDRIFAEGDDRG